MRRGNKIPLDFIFLQELGEGLYDISFISSILILYRDFDTKLVQANETWTVLTNDEL